MKLYSLSEILDYASASISISFNSPSLQRRGANLGHCRGLWAMGWGWCVCVCGEGAHGSSSGGWAVDRIRFHPSNISYSCSISCMCFKVEARYSGALAFNQPQGSLQSATENRRAERLQFQNLPQSKTTINIQYWKLTAHTLCLSCLYDFCFLKCWVFLLSVNRSKNKGFSFGFNQRLRIGRLISFSSNSEGSLHEEKYRKHHVRTVV